MPASSAVAAALSPEPPKLPDLLTLDEALRIFHAHGLDLLIAEAAVQSAEGDVKIAGAVANLNFQAGFYKSFFKTGLFETDVGWFVGLGDSNAIEDAISGKRGLRLKVANAALKAARMSRVDAERTLAFGVKQSYIQAVLARDALDFAVEVQKSTTRTYELMHLRLEKGAINEADEAKVETAKLEADQSVTQARQALQASKISLAYLLGVRGSLPDYMVEQDLPKYRLPPAVASATPDSLLRDAIDHRPDLAAIKSQRDRAEAGNALAHRMRFPDIGLNVQYSQQGSFGGSASADPMGSAITPIAPPTLTISLAGTLPIFYQQQGEVRKAEADIRTQSLVMSRTEAQVLADVRTAHTNLLSSSELVGRMEGRLLDRARRARDLVEIQYQKGAASLLEFLDAQRTYISTNVEYLGDLATFWTAVFQLEQAVGMDLR